VWLGRRVALILWILVHSVAGVDTTDSSRRCRGASRRSPATFAHQPVVDLGNLPRCAGAHTGAARQRQAQPDLPQSRRSPLLSVRLRTRVGRRVPHAGPPKAPAPTRSCDGRCSRTSAPRFAALPPLSLEDGATLHEKDYRQRRFRCVGAPRGRNLRCGDSWPSEMFRSLEGSLRPCGHALRRPRSASRSKLSA
jgi:hypothetical protein